MRLTLLVPELIWPEPGDHYALDKLTPPGLTWLLAHAESRKQPRQAFEQALATLGGMADLPLAALRLLGDGGVPGKHDWLCADPVHLRFHHERIVLADAGAFELTREEAHQLTHDLNSQFADIGEFLITDARRWYLRLNAAVDHRVEPISAVAGRRMDSELPKGDATLSRWLNEVQMFLHLHPVNAARQREGKPAVNSLWLWGGGKLTDKIALPFSGIHADNPLATGLALAAGTALHPRPETLADCLRQAGDNDLVVLDQLLAPVLYEDSQTWRSCCETLESTWFGPLSKALGKPCRQIDLLAPTVYGLLHYTLGSSERWKFWKKPRPLAETARQLAEQS